MNLSVIMLKLILATLLAVLLSISAVAQDIDFSDVTVSSNLEPLIDFDIAALSDGVTITPYPAGFAVGTTQTADGVEAYAEFIFTENFDLSSVKIWNGIDGPISGFKDIYFEFFNETGDITYKFPDRALSIDSSNPDAQLIPFNSSRTKNIRKVHIHFADASREPRGMSEVTFQGTLTDIIPPEVFFSPATLNLETASSATSKLTVIDDGGIPKPPVIQCTEGGSFTGFTFTAPAVAQNTTSVCTATATDVAGNTSRGTLTVSIRPKPDTTKPAISFSPAALTLNLETASSATSKLTIIDDGGIPKPPVIQCTEDGNFTGSTFTAPPVTQITTSICTATATDVAGNIGSGTLTVSIRPKLEPPGLPVNLVIVALALTALALIAIIALKIKSKAAVMTPRQSRSFRPSALIRPEPPHQDGIIFPQSPLLAGAVAPGPAPLAPAGQMVPSGLQTLTGQYAALKPAYRATGRIGGPQDGVPTNDDVSFGTGFLITPNHVMTNQHVYEFYKHYLTGPDCGGIEFIAERDRDASDYVPFNGDPPLILLDLDIAIFTLARSVKNRKPIARIAVPTEELSEREVITISYPCPFEVDEHILSVVEDDPIFAVKRLSQGRIFRHSTDTDTPFGVQVSVDERINPRKSLSAICHNASTLGGSSGAPVLDRAGNLVGVHFAGDRAFNGEEAANLAMAVEMLVHINPTAKGMANIA